ncbi:MAG: RpiB/LacA/LacB family sugar-phosphate isomerase [Candidatus Pacearchaeota archaeon]
MAKKIYLSGDHAGFKLKEKLKDFLEKKGYKVEDYGPYEYNKKDDYPDFVIPMAKEVSKDSGSRGIVIAGSGQGEAIAANKIKGVHAALYHGGSTKIVKTGRAHDKTNVLCIGSRFVTEDEAKRAINVFLNTEFDGGRHARRVNKVRRNSDC